MKKLNVLSVFGGGENGKLALDRADVPIGKYFSSEIDKYAVMVANHNHPTIKQVGDICALSAKNLPKIDVLMGGSPCQGFSVAGKKLNFDDERSKLFFEFVRLLKELKPKYFFLENVRMKQEHQDVISKYLGVLPVKINSASASAQNRERLYWTNLPHPNIQDKGIMLKDVVNQECFGAALRGQKVGDKIEKQLNIRKDGKSNAIVSSFHDKVNGVIIKSCVPVKHTSKGICKQIEVAKIKGFDAIKCVYSTDGESLTLTGSREPKDTGAKWWYRPLTAEEMEQLQNLPIDYTKVEGVSNTQRKKIIGNGWTVDVIAEFFKPLKDKL